MYLQQIKKERLINYPSSLLFEIADNPFGCYLTNKCRRKMKIKTYGMLADKRGKVLKK